MSENSRALGVCFAATLVPLGRTGRAKTMSQDLAAPTESGLARFRPFPEEEGVFDSGKFRGNPPPWPIHSDKGGIETP